MTTADPSVLAGLGRLLWDCLCCSPADSVLVLFDETTEAYASRMAELAIQRGVDSTLVMVPRAIQDAVIARSPFLDELHLPKLLLETLFEATAIVNALSGDLELKDFRAAVIKAPRQRGARLAHVPGISDAVLQCLAISNIEEARRDVEALALALGECRKLELYTNQGCTLSVAMGGWENEPIQSPGVIHPGGWGNVPPGEAFFCPLPSTVEGSVCINGSVPRIALEDGEEVILRFAGGRLADVRTKSERLLRFFTESGNKAKARGDSNWDVLAEIGIGVNRSIRRLSGNPLFDEKAYGTVHVALGDNSGFGHMNRSQWHADLVARSVRLEADGHPLVDGGEVQVDKTTWETDAMRCAPLGRATLVGAQLRAARLHCDGQKLSRRLARGGRVGLVQIGDQATTQALALLFLRWGESRPPDLAQLADDAPSFGGVPTARLLACLDHYGALSR